MRKPQPTIAQIKRTIRAWQACGLDLAGVDVLTDGTIRILAPGLIPPLRSGDVTEEETCDAAFGLAQTLKAS